ncbi:hypothetical protein [Croceicoccus mobilis]|uniref:Uncharacterized protein n=1 Tax=Croceicoccus mobilis TaxID=1703339 RepID=A0A916ZB66_9SPHN|nr:hypothetical protein [Croceicoccus mobilis]GGD85048.1 hypothetical protein GCM10010990_38820 [Croceicoccus mobilis]
MKPKIALGFALLVLGMTDVLLDPGSGTSVLDDVRSRAAEHVDESASTVDGSPLRKPVQADTEIGFYRGEKEPYDPYALSEPALLEDSQDN